ncbi:MAG: DinB family protein [Chloroflexi bacterium]|nr:DinB family protein [Chloroflexota bacterium]
MNATELFLQRYAVLCDYFIAHFWQSIPEELMRQRPDPRVNSITWNLWHITRVEDAGLNRFITDGVQILDEGDFSQRLNIPWRHQGTGMTFAEVDELSHRIDLPALREYGSQVQARTKSIVKALDPKDLDGTVGVERLRRILLDEGLARPGEEGLVENYTGWNKGRYLMSFGLTHSFQHAGEIGVIASLLGLEI